MQALRQTEAFSQEGLKDASQEGGASAAGVVFNQAEARKAAPVAWDQGPGDEPRLRPSAPSASLSPKSGLAPPGAQGLEGIRRRWGKLYLDGKELEALGQGDCGRVYAHPRDPGAVIKLMVFSAAARFYVGISKEQAAREDSQVSGRLAEIGAGPKLLGMASIPGEPSLLRRWLWGLVGLEVRVPDRPAVVKERVYGETVERLIAERRFTRRDYELVQRMIERMADGRVRAEELRPANLMIGRTLADAEPKAYFVDGGRLMPVENRESRKELLESLKRHQAPIAGGADSEGWAQNLTDPLDDVLRAGLAPSAER